MMASESKKRNLKTRLLQAIPAKRDSLLFSQKEKKEKVELRLCLKSDFLKGNSRKKEKLCCLCSPI